MENVNEFFCVFKYCFRLFSLNDELPETHRFFFGKGVTEETHYFELHIFFSVLNFPHDAYCLQCAYRFLTRFKVTFLYRQTDLHLCETQIVDISNCLP